MPATPYDLVKEDTDIRGSPLHSEQAFLNGITFRAKFIGSQEVQRPNTRAEIVQAMRQIRYDCKLQNEKKRKVTIEISVDGVRIRPRKKKRKKKQRLEDERVSMHHPIYRIFYVSHDSSDLKIFSYIARDGSTDTFRCLVFKSNKKSQAMQIVRTVGQAFEVCHKLNIQKDPDQNDDHTDTACDELSDRDRCSIQHSSEDDEMRKDLISVAQESAHPQRPNHLGLIIPPPVSIRKSPPAMEDKSPSPLSASKEVQKLKESLEQQMLQTRQALAQLMLVREQLITETNARIEAQARTQQLLQQNRELLEHLASLGGYSENERPALTSNNIGLAPQNTLPMLLQDQTDLNTARKSPFLVSQNNNSLPSINQQLSNLGSINQQLNTLSQQLSGLNQQNQNLQNIQNFNSVANQIQQQNLCNNNKSVNSNEMIGQQQDLFQMNQELLNRLQNLNIGLNTMNGNGTPSQTNMLGNGSPSNSFIFSNPSSLVNLNNNNNLNLLNTPSSVGNLSPSPTMSRSPYSVSPMPPDDSGDGIMDKHLELSDTESPYIKPISQVGTLTTLDSEGNVKVIVPIVGSPKDSGHNQRQHNYMSSPTGTIQKRNDKRVTLPDFVTLQVTDESGNVTNSRKLSATPSFITRSTSEKLTSAAKVARWFQQIPAWTPATLSRPESGFVSGDSRSEKNPEDNHFVKDLPDDFCDEFLLVEGSNTLWNKMSAKKRRKLLGLRLGKVTTF